MMLHFMFLFFQVLPTPFLEKGKGFTDTSSVIGRSLFYFHAVLTCPCCSKEETGQAGESGAAAAARAVPGAAALCSRSSAAPAAGPAPSAAGLPTGGSQPCPGVS